MTETSVMIREKELKAAVQAVRSAGSIIHACSKEMAPKPKDTMDNSVTDADLQADRVLKTTLLGQFPDYGWLSEETSDDLERVNKEKVWIVDPIDGTKEFIKGLPEYAVSVALVEGKQPIVAVVYNPATDELFSAVVGKGSALNGRSIHACHPVESKPLVLVSRSEESRGEFRTFEPHIAIRPTGSIAYKLALVAAGRGVATFSWHPRNEWDVAAGVLLVREAGGKVTNIQGEELIFNRPDPKSQSHSSLKLISGPDVGFAIFALLRLKTAPSFALQSTIPV